MKFTEKLPVSLQMGDRLVAYRVDDDAFLYYAALRSVRFQMRAKQQAVTHAKALYGQEAADTLKKSIDDHVLSLAIGLIRKSLGGDNAEEARKRAQNLFLEQFQPLPVSQALAYRADEDFDEAGRFSPKFFAAGELSEVLATMEADGAAIRELVLPDTKTIAFLLGNPARSASDLPSHSIRVVAKISEQ